MDRQAPKQKPDDEPAGFHRWRKLAFLHWEVPVEALRPLVHPRLEIDTYEGRAFIGVVPFTMNDVRFFPLPRWPGMTNFHETNVRTYVHLEGRDPGVWFFSLDAASRLCVLGARATYHLPYYFAFMDIREDGDERVYRSNRNWPKPRGARFDARIRLGGDLGHASAGTLEEFLCERYFLYSQKKGDLYRGQVHHTPYPLVSAELLALEQSLTTHAGVPVSGPPMSVLASSGVDVDVYAIKRV